jgi:hypothetical protein
LKGRASGAPAVFVDQRLNVLDGDGDLAPDTGLEIAVVAHDLQLNEGPEILPAYRGLTGKAVAAHFHGPAAVGASAPPVVPLTHKLISPIRGYTMLTAKQAADLEAGMWYFNIHTAKFPNGEIRGQVLSAKRRRPAAP